jgi:hypothetical protein
MSSNESFNPRIEQLDPQEVSDNFDDLVRHLATGTPTTPEDQAHYRLLTRFDVSGDPIVLPIIPGSFGDVLVGITEPSAGAEPAYVIKLQRTLSIGGAGKISNTFYNAPQNPLQIIDESGEVRTSYQKTTQSERSTQRLLRLYHSLTSRIDERNRNGILRIREE